MAATEEAIRAELALSQVIEHPANIIFARSPKDDMTNKDIMAYYSRLIRQKNVGSFLIRESRVPGCLSLTIHSKVEKQGVQVSEASHYRFYFANGKWNTHSPDTPLPDYTPLNLQTIGRRAQQFLVLLDSLGFSHDRMILATTQQASSIPAYSSYVRLTPPPLPVQIINSPVEGMVKVLSAVNELRENPQGNTLFKVVLEKYQSNLDDEGIAELFEEWLAHTPAEGQVTLLDLVQCPINLSLMTEPYVLSSGHVVNSDIAPMLTFCPMTKQPLDPLRGKPLPEIDLYKSMLAMALTGFREAVISSLKETQQSTTASSLGFFALSPNRASTNSSHAAAPVDDSAPHSGSPPLN
ncbi:hypothetical protein BN59_01662 [Legionella massiliensis]|uniref:SH2 domain-containing protein n=1 Tax=Legionella massiliensis TaxID=1034943 RepID=A0A078KZZ7_9GAMM|nr:SH2 domain-containing protein [Legionella massiliensis]CDZ77379.1 hypothetical protein BN59_01662 [Legionella massiliensis]CEE13117.1 hypothetical protein BN1094_01662 [Legionella massiliensis]